MLLAFVLAAASPGAPLRLAAPTFSTVNVSREAAAFYTDHFAQQLASSNLRVVTSSEIATMLGIEQQKQLLGCAEGADACNAELANALGVDAVVKGNIGHFGTTWQ